MSLKKKFLVSLPPICFTIIFSICFGVFSFTSVPKKMYIKENDRAIYLVEEYGTTVTVYDDKEKSGSSYISLLSNMSPYITEIENYVIVNPQKKQAYNLRLLMYYVYVRKIHFPIPKNDTERKYLREIYDVAKEYNVEIAIYE